MIMKKWVPIEQWQIINTINKIFLRIKNVFSNNKDYIKVKYDSRLGSLDLY